MSKKGTRGKPIARIRKKPKISPAGRDRLLLGGILFLALAVRLIALADLSGTPYFSFPLWDERIYHEWAKKIADGTFSSKSIYEFAPLYAYVMALLYKILSPDLVYVRILNVVLGVIVCGFVYLVGTALKNRTAGLLAALVAALYKPLILYSIVPLKETLAALCFAAFLYFFLALIDTLLQNQDNAVADSTLTRRHPFMMAFWLGIASGLLINVRPNALVSVPLIFILPVWYAFKDRISLRRVGTALSIVMLGMIFALSPFIMRNYLVAGKPALTTSQGGFNFYLGNNLDNPDPYYRPVAFATSSPFEQGIQFTIEAGRRTGKSLTPEDASRYWTMETIRQAANKPGDFTWKLWQKTLVVINRFEACDHYDIDFLSEFVKTFRLPFFSFWLIFPLAMVGMIHGIVHDRQFRALSILLASYALTLIAFFTSGRYRLPMVTLLIPFAVSGTICMAEFFRNRDFRKAGICVALTLLFLIAGNLPVRGTDDKTAYYNTHALILDEKGYQEEAIHYWRLSSEMKKPFSAFADISLATISFQQGKLKDGYDYLNRVEEDSFAAAQKYNLIGDILFSQQDLTGAAESYEKALNINSGQREILRNLIRIYRKTDPLRASRYEEKLKHISAFYDLF